MQPRKIVSGMRQWWQNWRRANSNLSELVCCGEYEAERMAHDLGLPVSELASSQSMVLKQVISCSGQ
jgi:hypothetical protein